IRGLSPSRALWEDRASYWQQLGDPAAAEAAALQARALTPDGPRDHYLLAITHAGQRRYKEAITELDQALRLNPRHYWSLLQRGICLQELGQEALALEDFFGCTILWPEFAWGHFNRGRVLHQMGR